MKSGDTDPNEERFFDEFGAMLRAYEGPARPVPRPTGARMRVRALAVAVALVVTCVAGAAAAVTELVGSSTSSAQALRHVQLPPLTHGPRKLTAPLAATTPMPFYSLEAAMRDAEVVFVGRVVAISGKEYVSPPPTLDRPDEEWVLPPSTPEGMFTYRVRYQVERVFRGDPVDTIDLVDWINPENNGYFPGDSTIDGTANALFTAEVGQRYLVFAVWVPLGGRRVRSLMPYGGYQNVYSVTSDDTAANNSNGTVRLDELAQRIANAQASPDESTGARG